MPTVFSRAEGVPSHSSSVCGTRQLKTGAATPPRPRSLSCSEASLAEKHSAAGANAAPKAREAPPDRLGSRGQTTKNGGGCSAWMMQ